MTIHAATLSTIRQQIARIPAGPGRSADEFKEDLRRTLDCMEVAETLETPAEPLRLREGGFYRRRDGAVAGPVAKTNLYKTPYHWVANGQGYRDDGMWANDDRPHNLDLIAEVTLSEDATAAYVDTICTPTVPVAVGRNTQIVDPDTGCLTELGAALLNGKDAQIAELRKMIEREIG